MARLQIQEAQHQRAGQTKQGRAEGDAHAVQRSAETPLELLKDCADVAPGQGQSVDDLTHPGERVQQTPEGSQQAQKDQQTGQIAGHVAELVQARADAVQQGVHGQGREAEPLAAAAGQHGRHRDQHGGRFRLGGGFVPAAKPLDPLDCGYHRDDLPVVGQNSQPEHAQDHAVKDRVGQKGRAQRLKQESADRPYSQQKQGHPDENTGRVFHGLSLDRFMGLPCCRGDAAHRWVSWPLGPKHQSGLIRFCKSMGEIIR